MGKPKRGSSGNDSGGHDGSSGPSTSTRPKGGDSGDTGAPGPPPTTKGTQPDPAAGPPPTGTNGLKHSTEHVESGAKGFDASAARIEAAHGKLSGVLAAKGSFWNKDDLGQSFGKVFEPLSVGHSRAGGSLQQAVKKTADNLRGGGARTIATDGRNGQRFVKGPGGPGDSGPGGGGNGPGKGGPGGPSGSGVPPTATGPAGANGRRPPVYFVDENDRVHHLVNGRLQPVAANDNSGIRSIMDPDRARSDHTRTNLKYDKDGAVAVTPRGKPKKAPIPGGAAQWKKTRRRDETAGLPARGMVPSRQLDAPTDLSRAVEDTRRAQGDYGGNNYASLRYRNEQGDDFILVGHSGENGSHSERAIGRPIIDNGMRDGVDSLYTERAPCQNVPKTGGIGCDRWVSMHLYDPVSNPGMTVTHGAEFDSSKLDGDVRNGPFNNYIKDLRDQHAAGNTAGLAGTRRYDY